MKLAQNETKTIEIYACAKWNITGIEVSPGEEYQFNTTGEWYDMGKKSAAAGYSNFYMRLWNGFRRHKQSKWFALIGSVDKLDDFYIGEQLLKNNFLKTGMLYCYANDAWWFYWNNTGHVTLNITRTK